MPVTKRWFKQLHDIDAQQPGGGHISNTMTLVAAGHPVSTQTYFRDDFFGDETWTPTTSGRAKPRETTTIECEVFVRGEHLGTFDFQIRHTPAYEADQSNRTTELVWGDLGGYLRDNSLVGNYATLEKLANGKYRLHLQASPTGEFKP